MFLCSHARTLRTVSTLLPPFTSAAIFFSAGLSGSKDSAAPRKGRTLTGIGPLLGLRQLRLVADRLHRHLGDDLEGLVAVGHDAHHVVDLALDETIASGALDLHRDALVRQVALGQGHREGIADEFAMLWVGRVEVPGDGVGLLDEQVLVSLDVVVDGRADTARPHFDHLAAVFQGQLGILVAVGVGGDEGVIETNLVVYFEGGQRVADAVGEAAGEALDLAGHPQILIVFRLQSDGLVNRFDGLVVFLVAGVLLGLLGELPCLRFLAANGAGTAAKQGGRTQDHRRPKQVARHVVTFAPLHCQRIVSTSEIFSTWMPRRPGTDTSMARKVW